MRQPAQFASGFLIHLGVAVLLGGFLVRPQAPGTPATREKPLVWAARAGLNGGGGGGDGVKASPAPLRHSVQPTPQFTLPQIPAAFGALELPGAVVVLSAAGGEGAGTDDGTEKGRGEGLEGTGAGPRSGPGDGSGDGPFQDGAAGVTTPQLLFDPPPEYSAQAVGAKIEGAVLLEATVLADGTVGSVKVVRSLERAFGLDQKAVEAVRRWKFRPGTYLGRPAAVKVLIELSFHLR